MDKPLALITGASSGIGAAYAQHLAAAGYDLIITARRQELLENLGQELSTRYSARVESITADLTTEAGISRLEQRIAALPRLDMLINNAGFGVAANFIDLPIQHHLDMVSVHVSAPMRLIQAALPHMLQQNKGAIINVASVAAFLPLPLSTSYSGTKGFLVNFSRALQMELAGTAIKVQALCPGFTRTGFHHTPEYEAHPTKSRIPNFMWGSSEKVVACSLRGLGHGDVVLIPTLLDRLIVFGMTTWPFSRLAERIARRVR